jgi:hypothetical protein
MFAEDFEIPRKRPAVGSQYSKEIGKRVRSLNGAAITRPVKKRTDAEWSAGQACKDE